MKKRKFIAIVANILILNSIECVRAQDDEKQITSMLTKFYTEYNKVWAESQFDVLIGQLDSLQQKYCTQKFRQELNKVFEIHGLDHDILLNDVYTEDLESLKTISVIKNGIRENTYYVSYTAVVTDANNKKINQKVQIHVVVAKVDGYFKIDNVLDD